MNQKEMSLQEYAEKTKEWMEQYLGNTYKVLLMDVQKNNGLTKKGLVIQDNVYNISPTIYLYAYYERFQNGASFEDLWSEIEGVYEKVRKHKDFNIKELLDFELVKGQIYFSLVNTELNKELLEDVPHISLHDLSIIFHIKIDVQQREFSKIMIRNDLQRRWNVDVEELYENALYNAEEILTSHIFSLEDKLLDEVFRKIGSEATEIIQSFLKRESCGIPLYVASNRIYMNGAAVILYKDLLKEFAQRMDSDIYILPSSIHEVLLLPAWEKIDKDFLKEIVSQVNIEVLLPEEFLSDNVYFYNRETDCIEIL